MHTPGERLRWLRKAAGLTTRRLDELAGLTSGHSTQVENGLIGDRVSARTLLDLAAVFGVPASWILDGTGAKPRASDVRSAADRAAMRLSKAG